MIHLFYFLCEEQKEMKLLDEDVRLWSSGNERNIQLLLSTLHDVRLISRGGIFTHC